MEISEYRDLINAVRCGTTPILGFTDEEFDRVKSCIAAVEPIQTLDIDPNILIDTSQIDCLPNAIAELQKMLEGQQGNFVIGIQHGILKAKIQELKDNLEIVKLYYDTRYQFLGELIDTLLKSGQSAANQKIENIQALPTLSSEVEILLVSAISTISSQLLPYFSQSIIEDIPSRTTYFNFRLIGKSGVTIKLPNPSTNVLEDTHIKIQDNPFLTTDLFGQKLAFDVIHQDPYNPNKSNNPPKEISDYDSLIGFLYNGIPNSEYPGLYKKLAKPLTYFFTLEERGLTLNESLIDPQLKSIKDAPSSINENDTTFYIQSQSTYETFYKTLKDEYPRRLALEKDEIYPNVSSSNRFAIQQLAIREATDIFRRNPLTGSSSILQFYLDSKTEIDKLIEDSILTILRLDESIKENIMDEDIIRKKILDIPCFTKAGNALQESDPLCENLTKQKLGTDPLYLRTLGDLNFGLPDIGSQCYWKEFSTALNKICLLPFPDLSGPPPANMLFRYWPINCVIPAGIALVLLPIPPVWKPLFVIPTAVGTLICFLTMPIAPIGIPLPSIYLFYFAPDGTKYLALAVNLPLLWSSTKNLIFGFEYDTSTNSQNPLGLSPTNPYKGYPIKGAFNTSLAITAESSRLTRMSKLAIDIASGKQPTITNINGEPLPFEMDSAEYSKHYISESEMMKRIVDADPSSEFDRQSDRLRATLNKQLDKLGDMQTTQINSLKQGLRDSRSAALANAENEKNLKKRRLSKKSARSINPITLQEKIESTVDAFNTHIDNIKFGTIRFPKDSTKNNPGLPEALTAIIDLITMGSVGDLRIEENAKSLNSQMKRAVANINMNAITTKSTFDLDRDDDISSLKQALNNMVTETLKYLNGESISFDVSNAKNDIEAQQIIAANKDRQELARNALAFTAVALLNPPKIQIFDFSKKCCEISSQPVFSGIQPELSIAFSVLSALMQAIIDGLTVENIVGFLGITTKQISSSFLITLFDSLISVIPNVKLPDPANLLLLIQSFLLPILTLISIPKAINPLQPPLISIVIPLDPILKPILKSIIADLIRSIFSLIDEAATSYKQFYNSETSSFNVGDTDSPVIPITNSKGVFGETEADKETLRQIFSANCNLGTTDTTVSVTVYDSGITGDQYLTFKDNTGRETSTNSPVFKVSITLADGTAIILPAFPLLALDIVGYFQLITSADIIEFVRTLMNSVFDIIISPLKIIADVISRLAISLNSFSYNIIEAAIPLISIIKLARIALDAIIPNSIKLKVISPDLFNLIQVSVIPALEAIEPVLKEVAWIGVLALCSLSSPITNYLPVSGARLIHPIMNSDDLPPWERLTHKNPLFAIFLDEIAWRGSLYSTGSLIFQTKTPAALPYTPIFPIVHISPHLL